MCIYCVVCMCVCVCRVCVGGGECVFSGCWTWRLEQRAQATQGWERRGSSQVVPPVGRDGARWCRGVWF